MRSILATICLAISITSIGQTSKPINIGETRELNSSILNEKRTINIYLPEDYKTDTAKYSVIYLLDGGLDEDFIHVSGSVQFNTFSWVARIPNSIVVGIGNTNRKRDMTFPTTSASDKKLLPMSGGSEKFIAFIEKELQPYIQNNYKVNNNKLLIGQSLGGLLATEILLTRPTLFNKYLIISPSLWWNDGSLLKKPTDTWSRQIKSKTHIYIAVGKEGLAPSEHPHVMEVDANLLKDKLDSAKNPNVNLYFDYLPDENHATIGHQAVLNGFRKLYQR